MLKEIIDLKFYELSQALGTIHLFLMQVDVMEAAILYALSRIFVPYKTEDVKLNAVDMIAGINQSK